MPDFDIFKNRWSISARIELETPLRIGGGQSAAEYSISSAPVLLTFDAKTRQYEAFIPGSSLKGVLRSTVERLIRTFNDEKSCVSVKNKKDHDRSLCGNCVSCGIFGSMEAGAKIRVRDSHLSDNSRDIMSVKEMPHCATDYRIMGGMFKPKTGYDKRRKVETVKTSPRFEETVTSGTCFDVLIEMDNADYTEFGLILLALDEFNKKRVQLGGAASRGNGFASVTDISVKEKTMGNDMRISETEHDIDKLMRGGKKYLKEINRDNNTDRRDFDIYYKARAPKSTEGHIVALLKVTTLTDFIMPGVEEATVTSGNLPVIPGSTIKGYFRHKLVEKCDADTIKEIFGYTDNHRGRLLISDAYSDELTEYDRIPANSVLRMWMVFDNMTKEEILLIDELRKQNIIVTGRTSSKLDKKTGNASFNVIQIQMEYEKLDIFRIPDYLEGI
ncbi:MAG: hypothetical protein IBX39_06685 [Candidatus Methanoperedenaceae archaeon]|nr:hypothetical protein [Candidatus Methanoperedenaceae archaeon]